MHRKEVSMSTRCEILIKDYGNYEGKDWKLQIKLYHHHDGYPEGVGKFLVEQVYPLLDRQNIDCDRVANFLIKHEEDNEFEATVYNHIDIEYRYVIDIPLRKIKCYGGHYSNSSRTRFCQGTEYNLDVFRPLEIAESYA